MNLVVDASVAAKWIFREADADKAMALQWQFERGRLELLAPDILPAEIANVIWKKVLRQDLDSLDAHAHYSKFKRVCPFLVSISSLAEAALSVSLRYRRTVYDSLYIALAIERGCEMLTADERLFNALRLKIPQVSLLRHWA